MNDNKILMTVELTPDDELVVRNAVTGVELARRPTDFRYRQDQVYSIAKLLDVQRVELHALIVDQDDEVSERYT